MSAIRYWVWLTTLRGLRATALQLVLEHFGRPMEAYYASAEDYKAIEGLTNPERELLQQKDLGATQRVLELCTRKNIRILTLQDADYPQRLQQINDPPPVLYVRGKLPYIDELPTVALVGTRRASVYGERMAARLGSELTHRGACVVTGLACGIDGAAAHGVLMAGGGCIGVLGSAIDVNYPAGNRELIDDVAATGAVISEFPPGYPTLPENFPRRNRIISGLSSGVCVVEAPARSGALITAGLALEQGRDLFAVPGNADNPGCEGSNCLLRDCAKAVMTAEDILSEYQQLYSGRKFRAESMPEPVPVPDKKEEPAGAPIDKPKPIPYIDWDRQLENYNENQQKILNRLREGEAHVDDIIADTGLSAALVLAELTILSVKGAVTPQSAKHYKINEEHFNGSKKGLSNR